MHYIILHYKKKIQGTFKKMLISCIFLSLSFFLSSPRREEERERKKDSLTLLSYFAMLPEF